MINLQIEVASELFQLVKNSPYSVFYFAGREYLSAPTFEEFLNRNRIKLFEEVVR